MSPPMFDLGAFTINDDLTLKGIGGKLRTDPRHALDKEQLAYRRNQYGPQ